ncbi:hypothetical protein QWZ10_25335 [Paracoccus cavernae]|uniref:ABC transporter ATP-binding protein n=1 Tax=Paracoccus cavernae TaxID=1571207 RepID=A0ABT8DF68_9RHOB|nr:hypothetical protein [Paracoccus cavernae]
MTIAGTQLVKAPARTLESVRGARIAMIFQDPSSSLNPVQRVGKQIMESIRLHRGLKGAEARTEAIVCWIWSESPLPRPASTSIRMSSRAVSASAS